MQFYLDSTANQPQRKLSPATSFVPYRPVATPPSPSAVFSNSTTPVFTSSAVATDRTVTSPPSTGQEDEPSAGKVKSGGEEAAMGTTDGSTTESEDDDSESLTTEASDVEVRQTYCIRYVFMYVYQCFGPVGSVSSKKSQCGCRSYKNGTDIFCSYSVVPYLSSVYISVMMCR
jgi:hypothetical protein